MSYRIATAGPALDQRWELLLLIGTWWATFALGAALVMRLPIRWSLVITLLLAISMRAVALSGIPVLSDDVYRYAWDGQVQATGTNPYRFPPTAPQLADLRGPWLWPDADGCDVLDRPAGCSRINRADERTIYPPLAQAWFRLANAVLLPQQQDRGWQALALVVDVGLVMVLALALRSFGHDPRSVALYAWSPIAVLESAQNAHLDVVAVLGAVAALWAARRQRHAVAGALLGAATLVKLYPLALLPVLLRRRPLRTGLAFAAAVGLGYLPHVAAVGVDVLGYLPGYLAEEGYAEGSRFLLVGLIGLSGAAAKLVVGLGLAIAAWSAWRSRDAPEVAARRLLGAALLLVTPVQPWYALLLVAVATLSRAWWWLPVAAAGYPLYLAALLDFPMAVAGRISYSLAAAVVAVVAVRARAQAPSAGTTGSATAPVPAGGATSPAGDRTAVG